MAFRCSNDRTQRSSKSKTSKLFRAGRRAVTTASTIAVIASESQRVTWREFKQTTWQNASQRSKIEQKRFLLCWRNVMYLMQLIFRFKETFILEVTFFLIRFQILFQVVTFCCCCRQHFSFLFLVVHSRARSALNPISNSNGALRR